MFLGKHLCSVDEKNRLLAPDSFREQLSGDLYISHGFDRNLLILTASAFQEVYRRVMSLNIADPLARLLLRMILGTACEIEMDDSGQVAIPNELRDFANLSDEAYLVGQGDYCEVWAINLWNKLETELRDAEKNASRFAGLTIAMQP